MTEDDWDRCTDPQAMLTFLMGKASDRKLRLFACAGWRRRFTRSVANPLRWSLDRLLLIPVQKVEWGTEEGQIPAPRWWREFIVGLPSAMDAALGTAEQVQRVYLGLGRSAAERARLCRLLRDVFGNPFRDLPPASWLLQWHGGIIKHLAEAAYEHRLLPSGHLDNARLGVVADALEEAGADAELVGHLRGPGPHTRGCFVVDLLTGRS